MYVPSCSLSPLLTNYLQEYLILSISSFALRQLTSLSTVCTDLNDILIRISPEDWQHLDYFERMSVICSVFPEDSIQQHALDIQGRLAYSVERSLDDFFRKSVFTKGNDVDISPLHLSAVGQGLQYPL